MSECKMRPGYECDCTMLYAGHWCAGPKRPATPPEPTPARHVDMARLSSWYCQHCSSRVQSGALHTCGLADRGGSERVSLPATVDAEGRVDVATRPRYEPEDDEDPGEPAAPIVGTLVLDPTPLPFRGSVDLDEPAAPLTSATPFSGPRCKRCGAGWDVMCCCDDPRPVVLAPEPAAPRFTPPRYDEVFADGVAWLNELDSPPLAPPELAELAARGYQRTHRHEPDEAFARRLADAAARIEPRSPEALAAFAAGPEVSGGHEQEPATEDGMSTPEEAAREWLSSGPFGAYCDDLDGKLLAEDASKLAALLRSRWMPEQLRRALDAWAARYEGRLARISEGSDEDYTGDEQDLYNAWRAR